MFLAPHTGGVALQASLLEKARELVEAAADGVPTTDCVLTVPSYFTPVQRQVGAPCLLL